MTKSEVYMTSLFLPIEGKYEGRGLDMLGEKHMRQFFQWCVAGMVAWIIGNAIVFCYERPVGWRDLSQGATHSIWHPGKLLIHGTEGRSIYRVDKNGYLNDNKDLEEEYTLCIGASHTQGKEIKRGYRYSDLLNDELAESDNRLAAYNLSSDGYSFPDLIKGFRASIEAFPEAERIILEIGSTYADCAVINDAVCAQRAFSMEQMGERAFSNGSRVKSIKLWMKENMPLISRIKSQLEILESIECANRRDEIISAETDEIEMEQYSISMNNALKCIRAEYEGELIIIYHPLVSVENDGMVVCKGEKDELFGRLCEENNIDFINTGDLFLNEYQQNQQVPYGFHNTSMGTGHLNKTGHRLMFEAIRDYIDKE